MIKRTERPPPPPPPTYPAGWTFIRQAAGGRPEIHLCRGCTEGAALTLRNGKTFALEGA